MMFLIDFLDCWDVLAYVRIVLEFDLKYILDTQSKTSKSMNSFVTSCKLKPTPIHHFQLQISITPSPSDQSWSPVQLCSMFPSLNKF